MKKKTIIVLSIIIGIPIIMIALAAITDGLPKIVEDNHKADGLYRLGGTNYGFYRFYDGAVYWSSDERNLTLNSLAPQGKVATYYILTNANDPDDIASLYFKEGYSVMFQALLKHHSDPKFKVYDTMILPDNDRMKMDDDTLYYHSFYRVGD